MDLVSTPLVDRSNFYELLSDGIFGSYAALATSLHRYGFGLLTIKDQNWLGLLDRVRAEIEPNVDFEKLRNGTLGPIRYQDAWLHLNLRSVLELACHNELLQALQVLYGRKPFPFQTLNFPNGTAQHFHSDAVHFHSLPVGYMCGAWVALEDVSPDSGPLLYFPGSHRLPYLRSLDLGLTYDEVASAEAPQVFYEDHWRSVVKSNGFKAQFFLPQKGDLLIWHANLLHGGSAVQNKYLTRWSQVTHYYFEGCAYTTPIFDTVDHCDNPAKWRFPAHIKIDH